MRDGGGYGKWFMVTSAFPRYVKMTALPPPSKHMCDCSFFHRIVLPGKTVLLQGRSFSAKTGDHAALSPDLSFPGNGKTVLELSLYPRFPFCHRIVGPPG
ncbi:unnamed protein product [Sphacelaria rigidula]